MLTAARAVQGAAGAAIMPLSLTLLAAAVPERMRNAAARSHLCDPTGARRAARFDPRGGAALPSEHACRRGRRGAAPGGRG